jgi:RNA polymerase sigma-70 factor, ECF subfamily
MTQSESHDSFIRRLREESDSAANELDERYRSRLCQLVEREMNQRFRRKEDPEDVVQSVFRTFWRRKSQAEFHIDSSADLWRLLGTIAHHKLLKHIERLDAKKRDTRREEYPDGDQLHSNLPTPEEAAIAADLIEGALAELDEPYVEVFQMRMQNCTEQEIASKLDCTRAFVRTKLKRICERLRKLSAENADD